MALLNKTLNDFHVPISIIQQDFLSLTKYDPAFSDLYCILNIGLNNMTLFPQIRLSETATHIDYLDKWIKGYSEATLNLPSKRHASPKGSCSDPAITTIVQKSLMTDDNTSKRLLYYHNLFMSAENIQGNLLEEYISREIRPYGWLWCNGNVLRAVDFCTTDGTILLQIKNKSNTENSSSSAIRTGTDIIKWYRLGTQTRNGIKYPTYKWEQLNKIINSHVPNNIIPICNMNEESYQNFLKDIISNNPNIICGE